MKIDFTKPITDLAGKPMQEKPDTPLTLATAAATALVSRLEDATRQPEQMDGMTKVRLASLAEKIFTATDPVELKIEDVATIKERIGRAYGAIVVMRAWAMLEAS